MYCFPFPRRIKPSLKAISKSSILIPFLWQIICFWGKIYFSWLLNSHLEEVENIYPCVQLNLQNHQRNHHTTHEFSCEFCNFKTNSKGRLLLHMQRIHSSKDGFHSHQRYICDKCPFKSNNKTALEKHVENIHGGSIEHQCEHCEYTTMFAKELRKHYLYRHKPGSDRIPCDQCHFTTTRADALKRHIENKHLGIKHQCNLCNYSSGDKSDLTKHKRLTHGEKVTCEICCKEFTAGSYIKHKKTHKLPMKYENWTLYTYVISIHWIH